MTRQRTDQDVAIEFGERLRARREATGRSQERLTQDAGLSWSTVSQVERGERAVRLGTLLHLAEALGLDPGELITGMKPAQSFD